MKEAEIKYIQVKGHQDEIQVLLLLRRYPHTHPARRAGCSRQLFVTTNDQHENEAKGSAVDIFQK